MEVGETGVKRGKREKWKRGKANVEEKGEKGRVTNKEVKRASLPQFIMLATALAFLIACGAPPVENKKVPTPAPTPIPPEAERIQKPVNISFSTYSREWGVGWQWVDPDEAIDPTPHDVKTGMLRVRLTARKDLTPEKQNAPRYVKPIAGDFQIETRVRFNPTENYEGAGVVIYNNPNNFLRFERSFGGPGGGGSGIRLDANKAGVFVSIAAPGETQTSASAVDLRLVRTGQVFSAYWREDENGEWRAAGDFDSDYPDAIMAGVLVCNTAREAAAEFEYIKLLPVAKK
jgi:regulation of enolase protein 1 (concanavalin A-like superfamily)